MGIPRPRTPDDGHGLALTTTRPAHGASVVTAVGEIDASTCRYLQARLDEAALTEADSVIVDLTGVSFLGCAGMEILVAASGRFQQLCLATDEHIVLRALQVTGIADRFPVFPSVAEALSRTPVA
ncbi:hypothetical protein CFN78_04370 [Amycolatopsis antarctica]|uniref:Anti-sigma factor antagonist n=1 Tax=Amycolatopsis antarctica TaxID=1854586 RepID=A0A263D7C1_9PSEU|nr:STAS domain-containing protein [Amycolatopsis antarctica]OZM74370.1 hypothetical protein CFN78_04370 [Amycolatopsis antarctica]